MRALRASGHASLTVSSTDTPPVLGTWTKSTLRESLISTRRGYPTPAAPLRAPERLASRRDDDGGCAWLPRLAEGPPLADRAGRGRPVRRRLPPRPRR